MSTASLRLAETAPANTVVRVVTAASLFDGHDASINIVRRILQAQGAEVIHLGHDRGVDEIVDAALQEDAHAICISSYQGGHMEYFGYLVEQLRARGAGHVRVYGGGGGVIAPDGNRASARARRRAHLQPRRRPSPRPRRDDPADRRGVRAATAGGSDGGARAARARCAGRGRATGELAGGTRRRGERRKSNACARRSRPDAAARPRRSSASPEPAARASRASSTKCCAGCAATTRLCTIGCLLVDPTRRRTGGALLGDRIRMNAIGAPGIYVRSLATRQAHLALSQAVRDAVAVLQAANFDLLLVETAGIGQSDSEITELADVSIYVMTPEYGAPSQLEKIDMLDLADFVVLNKSDRHGAEDALRDVRKQWRRNRTAFDAPDEAVPVFATIASRFGDAGTERFYRALVADLAKRAGGTFAVTSAAPPDCRPRRRRWYRRRGAATWPRSRRPCAGIAPQSDAEAERASDAWALERSLRALGDADTATRAPCTNASTPRSLRCRRPRATNSRAWPSLRARYAAATQSYDVRGRAIPVENHVETLVGTAGSPRRGAGDRRVGRGAALPAPRERARRVSVHRGRVPVQARGRRADADVRRRGNARAHQPPLPSARGRAGHARAFRPPSTASRSMDAIPTSARTSGARSATRVSRSAPSTTRRSSIRASTSATRRPPSR